MNPPEPAQDFALIFAARPLRNSVGMPRRSKREVFIHGGYNSRALGTLLKRKKHLDEFDCVPKLPTFDRALPHPIVCALPNEQYEEVVKRFSGGQGKLVPVLSPHCREC